MKSVFLCSALMIFAPTFAHAQGTVVFANSNGTKVSTNSVGGGAATGVTATTLGGFVYALYYSQTATTVNGGTNSISGSINFNNNAYVDYAFNDTNWTLVAYGTNISLPGRFLSASADSSAETPVPGAAGGTATRFVIIGWSANIGTDIAAVKNWFGFGEPLSDGFIGQSAVSGIIYPGTVGITPPASLFSIPGFMLGLPVPGGDENFPPYITDQPANVIASVGTSATFSVVADAWPSPSFQWQFNGSNILGAISSTLTIQNVQTTNAGSYSVFISNLAGSTNSYAATLTVNPAVGAPPTISSQPADLNVLVGNTATFAVSASGTPLPGYQWSFNGTNIATATNSSLILTDVQTNNAGSYAVAITNSYGATNSASAVLNVLPLQGWPPAITAQPVSLMLLAGNNATFAVSVTGTAPFAYQWTFQGTNLPGATNASLQLLNIQAANAGNYAAAITNAYGSTNSFAATLTISPTQSCGYVIFVNLNASVTKIYTNSAVGDPDTGLTATNVGMYCYALYASATATSVLGQTSAITGNASVNYAFNDPSWTLVAYGTNLFIRGRLISSSESSEGYTPVLGFAPETSAQFVVIGWSANIGTDIPHVESWFGMGDPAFDGWIGQSAVSGTIYLSDPSSTPPLDVFGLEPPQIQGFTLGLASPDADTAYPVPYAPPALLQTWVNGSTLQLSWPTASGSWEIQSAPSPSGPWSDTSLQPAIVGSNSVVTVTVHQLTFYRLVAD